MGVRLSVRLANLDMSLAYFMPALDYGLRQAQKQEQQDFSFWIAHS